jgi:hypothetical protein
VNEHCGGGCVGGQAADNDAEDVVFVHAVVIVVGLS